MNDVTANFSYLEKLEKLAEESSSDNRRELMREVADVLLDSAGDVDPDLSEEFDEVLGQVVHQMESNIRQHLADSVAAENSVPHSLIVQLANDEIEIARPVIEQSALLQDQDLIDIVKKMGQEHMMAVTVRPTVNEAVSDVLVQRGNDDVLSSLAGNEGAEISQQSLTTMVDRSSGSASLSDSLTTRKNLPSEIEEQLFLQLSGVLKDKILGDDTDVTADMIDQFLLEARNHVMISTENKAESEADKFIARKDKLGQLNTQFLQKLIREGKTLEFAVGIARFVGIDLMTARKAVLEEKGERLAIICKAVGFDTDAFSNILALTDPKHLRSPEQNSELLTSYSRVPVKSAQRAIRFLRTRQNLM